MVRFETYSDTQLKNSWSQLKSSLRCQRINGWLQNQEDVWKRMIEQLEREMDRRNLPWNIKKAK